MLISVYFQCADSLPPSLFTQLPTCLWHPREIKDWNHRSVILTDNSDIKALAYVLGLDKCIRWWMLIISATMIGLVYNMEHCRIWDVVRGRLVRKFKISGGGKCVLQREHAVTHTSHLLRVGLLDSRLRVMGKKLLPATASGCC